MIIHHTHSLIREYKIFPYFSSELSLDVFDIETFISLTEHTEMFLEKSNWFVSICKINVVTFIYLSFLW